jgi:hypothetical protein
MTGVAGPRWMSDARAMAGQLSRGSWLVARWEHLGPDEDLPQWQSIVRAACDLADVDPLFIDIRRRSLTVVVNAALPAPDADQIHTSIAAVETMRSTERQRTER